MHPRHHILNLGGIVMEQKKKLNMEHEDIPVEEGKLKYDDYYNNVLVREQPFYRKGMTKSEAEKEMEYLNNNLQIFYEGKYTPLWKQNSFK